MQENRLFNEQYRAKRMKVVFLLTVFGACLVYIVSHWTEKNALLAAEDKARSVLAYQTSDLVSRLNKFSLITALISRRPDVVRMFRLQDLSVLENQGKQLAAVATGLSGAKDFWFVDKEGSVFSSNNPQMIGRNVSSEPYFEAGFQGRLGRASEVQSGFRSYIFASPVFVDSRVEGLVAVRIDLEDVENVWALLTDPIIATEKNNRILLSNVEDWRLKQFVLPEILGSNESRSYSIVTQDVPLLQWQVHVLSDLKPVRQQRLITMVIGSLLVILLVLLVWILFERRRRLIEQARTQEAFSLKLEKQVQDRTHELTISNTKLESEVTERRAAEAALRETQQELVQAAKLAGIGQMSAALAHEYNQPLAAIRSYADNAVQLLDLDKEDDVKANLGRITSITERMADLTKTLRSFAHRSETVLEPVPLSEIVDEMIILLSPQAKKHGVDLKVLPPKKSVTVMAGRLRLSQVVINLVTNGMDAAKESESPYVEVSWKEKDDCAEFFVKDSGSGISEDVKDKIFTPFFTTKGAGVGLGLGLFIVYNMVKEFKGTIEVVEDAGYGAVFYMTLPLYEEQI